jgi:hypothetical protein
MPARKAAKKGAKKSAAKKSAGKSRGLISPQMTTAILLSRIKRREWVMYGLPIWNVAALGNIAQMRSVAQAARTHMADVQRKLNQLDAAISKQSK